MDNILAAIESRRARRAISDQRIPRETAELLLTAAHLAPSCANNQPWRFIAINEPAVLKRVKEHLSRGNYWATQSPLIVAVASRADLDCQIPDGREYYAFGCGMATMNLMLQATELKLIAHPIAGFKQAPVKDVLEIPDDYTLITLIILGHPAKSAEELSEKHRAEESSPRARLPLNNIVCWNRFGFSEPAPPPSPG
ncbi:nitroreductase family protein [Candidatus Bipolaricaulota bacterium]